jgi:2,3-bisphosphoglycerate-dependent phosphoglycerate mutase
VTSRDDPHQAELADRTPEGGYRQHRFRRPPGATEILLIRHGESQPAFPGKPFPLTDGRADPALAPEGVEQAQRIADRLATQHIDAIYVTSLRRTAQTAEPLARRLGLVPNVERQLREVGLGQWEGGVYRERVAQNGPTVRRMLDEGRWDVIPGAEPAGEFAGRVRDAIERLAAAHPDQRLAVFTHGGVIGQAMALASSARVFAFIGADNGSISHLVVRGGDWVVRGFNDTAHLDRASPALSRTVPAAS